MNLDLHAAKEEIFTGRQSGSMRVLGDYKLCAIAARIVDSGPI